MSFSRAGASFQSPESCAALAKRSGLSLSSSGRIFSCPLAGCNFLIFFAVIRWSNTMGLLGAELNKRARSCALPTCAINSMARAFCSALSELPSSPLNTVASESSLPSAFMAKMRWLSLPAKRSLPDSNCGTQFASCSRTMDHSAKSMVSSIG